MNATTAARTFTGTGRLVRLAVRRDRILLPVWILAISGIAGAVVASYAATLPNEAERAVTAAFSASNPMTRVFDGAASGTSLGAMSLVEGYKVLAILTALMSAQAVVRHTRQDEETGRAELLGSAVVGRHARLTAALVVTLSADLVLGAAVAGALVGTDLPVSGSLAAGVAVAGTGWVFAGIAAVAAQVLTTARGANAVAAAALGVAFVVRAVGNLLGEVTDSGVELVTAWPAWLSPLGWGQEVRPFDQDNWWVAGLFVGLTAVLVAVAFVLTAHRDVGSGMVPARSGPAYAPRGLRSATGLAWRLQRGVLLAWLIGLVGAGAAFGAVGKSAEDLVADNDQMEQMLARLAPEGGIVDLYFTLLMAIIGVAAAGYTVQALLRMRAEEATGRLEPVLSTAAGRTRWLAGHVVIAAGGTTAILVLSGLAGGLVYGSVTGSWAAGVSDLLGAALVQVPAALALGALVLALFGLLPRWAGSLAWAALAVALVMGQLGALLDLPQWLLNVSPFTHVPRVPAEAFSATPVVWLVAVTIALGAVGFAAFRRRDLAIGA
ncbi:ABC transporter permease [Cellulomonas sp. KRMCY2]|uniref:ABC transporter permease n=1 Tax=Cellulomonas sp. KRMCY2 TaxID=1304865 RepID=UPI00045E9309|nr:hypothetical protein [Cellulomonas sp. KRMCY2]